MKKVNIFGKSVPVLVLALITVGLASAGLLGYYGMITGAVTVEQSVKLDDKSCDGGCVATESVNGVAGSQIHGDVHSLKNANPDIDAIVSLDLTTACPNDDCAGLTVAPKFRLDAILNNDNDAVLVIPPTTIWSDFVDVEFTYLVESGSNYMKTPHVNIMLRDSDGNNKCLLVSNEEDVSQTDTWYTETFIKSEIEGGSQIEMVSGGCSDINGLKFNSVTIEVADGWDVIQSGQEQIVWVKNVKVDGLDNLWFRVPQSDFGNAPARIVHFMMGYDFAMNAYPGTYTVNTDVTPRGTYTQGGVYTP